MKLFKSKPYAFTSCASLLWVWKWIQSSFYCHVSPVSWQCFLPNLKLQTQRGWEEQHDIVSGTDVRAGAQASERKSGHCCVSDIVYMTQAFEFVWYSIVESCCNSFCYEDPDFWKGSPVNRESHTVRFARGIDISFGFSVNLLHQRWLCKVYVFCVK